MPMKRSSYKNKLNMSGERIRILRNRKGLTQEQLAAKVQACGVENFTGNAVSAIEKYDRSVSDFELRFIAEALGAPIEWFVQDADEWDWDSTDNK